MNEANPPARRATVAARALFHARVCVLGVACVLAGGCPAAPGGAGDVAATSGGQEDIAAARQAIAEGEVPNPEAITVEGFLSEHAIPIVEPPSAGKLYAAATVAWHQDFDAFTPLVTVQLGMGTTIPAGEFERAKLNLAIVIDRSGSMNDAVDERSGTTKLEAVRIAIDRVLAHLTADDRVSVVAFRDRGTVLVARAAGNDLATIKTAISQVTAEGASNLASGMSAGYTAVRANRAQGLSNRIMVFTDAELNRRQDDNVRQFLSVMREQATQNDIGTTFFGVGYNFGTEVAYDISQVRGGNYFFLSDYDRILEVLDDEFDYLVTPVAYDATFAVDVPFEFDVVDVHGTKITPPFTNELEVKVPTVFFSSREGGGQVFVRIRPGALVNFEQATTAAEVAFSYELPDGERFVQSKINARLPLGLSPQAQMPYFASDSARRGVLLLNTALVLKSACADVYIYDDYWGYYYYDTYAGRTRALARLVQFLPFFDNLAVGLEDRLGENSRSLSQERALVDQLRATLRGLQ